MNQSLTGEQAKALKYQVANPGCRRKAPQGGFALLPCGAFLMPEESECARWLCM